MKLLPYKGTMPVNSVMVENAIAMHLKSVCTPIPQQLLLIIFIIINNNNKSPTPNLSATKTICYNKFRNIQALKKKKYHLSAKLLLVAKLIQPAFTRVQLIFGLHPRGTILLRRRRRRHGGVFQGSRRHDHTTVGSILFWCYFQYVQ
jgi:hypothetical protein